MMKTKLDSFFSRYEFLIPLFIFVLFLAVSLPGNSWGAPSLWNPDELIWRVDQALGGYMKFDVTEPDANYPSLPKYVMYAIGSIIYGLGKSTFAFIVAARSFSAVLGALSGMLVYFLARMLGATKRISILAGLLYIASGIAAANGRFAHNDLYLQLFSVLCVFFVLRYRFTDSLKWLYASFFSVGLAASSKYTGGSLILLPIGVYLFMHWRDIPVHWLKMAGLLLLGGLVSYLGYGLGTPRSIFDPVNYFTGVFVALQNYPQYGFNSGTALGLFGQWKVFEGAVGIFAYYLFIISFIWSAVQLILWKMKKGAFEDRKAQGIVILISAILIFDLPFMISVNYIDRYFIPFVPFLAVLSALFVDEILRFVHARNWAFAQLAFITLLVIGFVYSALRLTSITLLFLNDARIPGGEYIAGIRGYQKSIEYTLYPPNIEKKRFMRAHNYPIYFVKYPDDVVPAGGRFEYNQGEQGLLERDTDYFVIDSYTYDRFYVDTVCETNPVECDFFKRLIAGDVETFQIVKKFSYELPPYLPRVSISAVNPDVLLFERVR
ncbi:MAG: phospholipid carrier-dependent glycosyltransferase [Anaerolineales bacterium]|nr:phospholipid carrier-dependent glycosyltransferase [Anaerolineales bacterium]MCB9111263.1 phospholipid carrier-dependent glycosyltransferase [Anaerolineales bacterium]